MRLNNCTAIYVQGVRTLALYIRRKLDSLKNKTLISSFISESHVYLVGLLDKNKNPIKEKKHWKLQNEKRSIDQCWCSVR